MSRIIEVPVPDIGDFKNIPVIDVLVKPGDAVEKEAPLVTLESDKATIDIPSPSAGIVKELRIKSGDKVSQGTLLLTLESAEAGAAPQPVAKASERTIAQPKRASVSTSANTSKPANSASRHEPR